MGVKTILAVWHSGGKGKTSSLRAAAQHLLSSYPNFTSVQGAPSQVPATGDFRIVVRIGRKVVAIESKGDPHTKLFERLEDLENSFSPDIILCSTRTKGDTVAAVEEMERRFGFEAIWTSTYQSPDRYQAVANDLKGRHLVGLLQGLGLL